jgi:hypothetical protein
VSQAVAGEYADSRRLSDLLHLLFMTEHLSFSNMNAAYSLLCQNNRKLAAEKFCDLCAQADDDR